MGRDILDNQENGTIAGFVLLTEPINRTGSICLVIVLLLKELVDITGIQANKRVNSCLSISLK
jgi:hypothetical protein